MWKQHSYDGPVDMKLVIEITDENRQLLIDLGFPQAEPKYNYYGITKDGRLITFEKMKFDRLRDKFFRRPEVTTIKSYQNVTVSPYLNN